MPSDMGWLSMMGDIDCYYLLVSDSSLASGNRHVARDRVVDDSMNEANGSSRSH